MSQTTLEQAARWVADAAGLNFDRECSRVIDLVNDIREMIYEFSPLAWRVTLCAPVKCFCQECGNCQSSWNGIALPAYVENVLAVWHDDRPLPVTDRWGIYPYDAEWWNRPTMQAIDMGTGYPFLVDPPCDQCFQMAFRCRLKADAGKMMTIRYMDRNGINRVEEIELSDLWTSTKYPVRKVEGGGISLPLGRTGNVQARTADGLTLGEWEPWETVPSYRRIKLPGRGCCPTTTMLSIHAERRFHRLSSLAEVVETDKKLIWEDGYRHLLLHRKAEADDGDNQNAMKFITAFRTRVQKEAEASWGRTKRASLRFVPASPRRSGLRGKM